MGGWLFEISTAFLLKRFHEAADFRKFRLQHARGQQQAEDTPVITKCLQHALHLARKSCKSRGKRQSFKAALDSPASTFGQRHERIPVRWPHFKGIYIHQNIEIARMDTQNGFEILGCSLNSWGSRLDPFWMFRRWGVHVFGSFLYTPNPCSKVFEGFTTPHNLPF